MNYIALGTELTLGKFCSSVMILSLVMKTWIVQPLSVKTVPDSLYAFALQKCSYTGHWVIALPDFSEDKCSTVRNVGHSQLEKRRNRSINTSGEEHIRYAYGIVPVVEYYPWSNLNLRFLQTT
jgi:hypothetical protein